MLVVNKLQRVPSELNEAGVNRGTNYENQMVRFELDKASAAALRHPDRHGATFPVLRPEWCGWCRRRSW